MFVLWPQLAVETMHYLLCCLYSSDGWIRGGNDLCRQGEHWIFLEGNLDQMFFSSVQPLARRGNTVPLKFLGVANAVITAVASLCVTCPVSLLFARPSAGPNSGRSTNARK